MKNTANTATDTAKSAPTYNPQQPKLNWFDLPYRKDRWLVYGMITSDGYVAIIGKPKAGKSSLVRFLVVCVIKNRRFLNRSVDLPDGAGKVLYIHLDRKDIPWRVAQELKDTFGVTEEESARLHIRFAEDLPTGDYDTRLTWLQTQVAEIQPHMVVIDLMWQFAEVKNGNDYQAVLQCINKLQDALSAVKYSGALVVTLHARKATNLEDEADDVIGSSAQRGSFATGIYLTRSRNQDYYSIMTDQTIRDIHLGEIDKTVLIRKPDGSFELGQPVREIEKQEKINRGEFDFQRLLRFVNDSPGCTTDAIMRGLSMSRKHMLALLSRGANLFRTEGQGVKGDQVRYYANSTCDKVTGIGEQARLEAA